MGPGLSWPPPPHLPNRHSHSLLTNPFLKLNSTPPYPGQRLRVRGKIRTLLTLTGQCHAIPLRVLGTSSSSWFSFPANECISAAGDRRRHLEVTRGAGKWEHGLRCYLAKKLFRTKYSALIFSQAESRWQRVGLG